MSILAAWVRVIVVTVVLLPFVYWATRVWGTRAGAAQVGRHLQLLESLSLSPETRIAVVRILGRTCVVGVSSHGVQVLEEVTDPSLLAELSQAVPLAPSQGDQVLSAEAGALVKAGAAMVPKTSAALRRITKPGVTPLPETVEADAQGTTVLLKEQISRLRKVEVTSGEEALVAAQRR